MKKRSLLAILLALVLLVAGCSKSEKAEEVPAEEEVVVDQAETEEQPEDSTEDDDSELEIVKVDPSKIVVSDEIQRGFPLREDEETKAGYLKESYEIKQSQSYEDEWFREYEVVYPKFTDEIEKDGADAIKEYFENKAQEEQTLMEKYFDEYGIKDELMDSAAEKEHFYFKNYEVAETGDFLSVKYHAYSFFGGAHGMEETYVDNFDMNTGKLLTLDDVLGEKDSYAPALNDLINAKLKEQDADEVDITALPETGDGSTEPVFELTETGIKFIFNPYIAGPYALGTVEAEIPYADLADFLQITVNA